MSTTKRVSMHLWKLENSDQNIDFENELKHELKARKNVCDRNFLDEASDEWLCGLRYTPLKSFTFLNVGRYKKGAAASIIATSDKALNNKSLTPSDHLPPQDNDFLKSEVFALFHKNSVITVASDGRCFSDLWSFLRSLFKGKNIQVKPCRAISQEGIQAIDNHGVRCVNLTGFSRTQTIHDLLHSNNKSVDLFDTKFGEEDVYFKTDLKISPPRPIATKASEFIKKILKKESTELKLTNDFEMTIITKKGEKIVDSKFCVQKEVDIENRTDSKYEHTEQACKEWASELIKKDLWPNE